MFYEVSHTHTIEIYLKNNKRNHQQYRKKKLTCSAFQKCTNDARNSISKKQNKTSEICMNL